ncbi:Rv0909 family putative TA system antitoxin [Subtercola sp. YIM 133946]|uniref:Rv0909 family putative TA system antitoxin n=1 Tax=Subtercola sp. YIM 133946 TaxID=3118909 RepID=UPI002F93D0ED
MVDFGSLGDKAKEFADSDKGEQVTDGALQKADDAASTATGGKFDDKIDDARTAADGKIGQ